MVMITTMINCLKRRWVWRGGAINLPKAGKVDLHIVVDDAADDDDDDDDKNQPVFRQNQGTPHPETRHNG
eukprot:2451277-Amphidinium_carterae.1